MVEAELIGIFKKNKKFERFYMKRIAAIDLGSNAIRLTIAEVHSPNHYKILEKFRFPVRIGGDVFETGEVSQSKIDELIEVFHTFKSHLAHYQVQELQAIATSALRDANNSSAVIKKIADIAKIKLKIISGLEEAGLIYQIIAHELPIMTGKTLLIDIGGGSTEVSFINEGILEKVQSFNIGTIRVLKGHKSELPQMMDFVKSQVTGQRIKLVGTGGNLRRLGKLRKKIFNRADASIIHKNEVFEMYDHIKGLSPLHLMKKFDLKHDRAEVIVPALHILTTILHDINVDIINLPKVGLSDSVLLNMSSTSTFSLVQ